MFRLFRSMLFPFVVSVVTFTACPSLISNEEFQKQNPSEYAKDIPVSARSILENAEEFELLSLNPHPLPSHGAHLAERREFYGFPVLGATVIHDTSTRVKIVAALEKGISENDGRVPACFNPRHGIHVTREKQYADFVICFQCKSVLIRGVLSSVVLTTDSPQHVFNDVLVAAQVPLASANAKNPLVKR